MVPIRKMDLPENGFEEDCLKINKNFRCHDEDMERL